MATDGQLYKKTSLKKAEIICAKYRVGDTKASIKFTIGGLGDPSEYCIVSESAYNLILKRFPKLVKSVGIKRRSSYGDDIRIEHVIPSELVYQHFEKLAGKKLLSINVVQKVVGRLTCALITKREDDLLTKAGLRSDMPCGCDFLTCDQLARYKAVGIRMHQW